MARRLQSVLFMFIIPLVVASTAIGIFVATLHLQPGSLLTADRSHS
ncbi:MAG: hypothetical protein AB8I08_35110 [Sandaracinaceae bacterium]